MPTSNCDRREIASMRRTAQTTLRSRTTEVDAYIARFEPVVQTRLSTLRSIFRSVAKTCEEQISYGIPTLKIAGRPFLYFAAFKNHIGIYPMTAATKTALAAELAPYPQSKGTVRLPHSVPLPVRLIRSIAVARMKELKTLKQHRLAKTAPRATAIAKRKDSRRMKAPT